MDGTAPAPRSRPAAARSRLVPSRLRVGLWPTAAVLGIAAELAAGTGAGAARVLLDLVTGWTLIACGLIAWDRRPESRIGALMVVAGFTWFAGNFAVALAYLHRGPLAHVVLGYPAGRVARAAAVVAGAWYVAGAVEPLAESDRLTIALSVALVAAALLRLTRSSVAERRDLARAAVAAAAIAMPLVVGSVLGLRGTSADFEDPVLTAYEVAIIAAAVTLLGGVLGSARERATAVVLELGGATGAGGVRDALAHALADPSLAVGYWLPATAGYVDEQGVALSLPHGDGANEVTLVDDDGSPVAAIVHEPGLLDDPGLAQRVSSALRVAVANVRLQAQARAQLEDVRASRRRVVAQADAQRRLVERRLQAGPERRLAALESALERARRAARPAAASVLAEAGDELRRTRVELQGLARGLQPPAVTDQGLRVAVDELAARAPVPVDLRVTDRPLSARVEASIYFLCSEALANVAKHAHATRAGVEITVAGALVRVAVWDDGRGGADPARGSGLQGLADRVDAAGGALRVESPPGGGTRLVAELPWIEP